MKEMTVILGIETSCDDTCVALVRDGREVLAGKVMSQNEVHSGFGGVVPELASRSHIERLMPLLHEVTGTAGVSISDVDGIAVTYGPGLIGALIVGISFAKALSFSFKKALIGIHHIEAHIYAALLQEPFPPFPHIALVISGGHTCAYRVDGIGDYKLLGQTLDDAAGEAFDKVGKLLELPFPGGPAIEKAAFEWNEELLPLPRPCSNRDDCCWSFSGLKTAVMNLLNSGSYPVPQVAASFQAAVADVLVDKTLDAATKGRIKHITIGGGVAANSIIRRSFEEKAGKRRIKVWFSPRFLCTDNAVMVAGLGYYKYLLSKKLSLKSDYSLNPVAHLPLVHR